jgi:hypothetical protein
MMTIDPVYHLHAGGNDVVLRGQDQVKGLYRMWAETDQSIFFIESEEVAVANHYIASVAVAYQQVSGKVLNQAQSHLAFDLLAHRRLARLAQVCCREGRNPDPRHHAGKVARHLAVSQRLPAGNSQRHFSLVRPCSSYHRALPVF